MRTPKLAAPIALCGTRQPDAVGRTLTAGAMSVEYSDGQLRYLRFAGVEVLRGLAFLVRDSNWGTWVPKLGRQKIDQRTDGFVVSYRATCENDEQKLVFDVTIEGNADGRLTFKGVAHAHTDFLTARTGFVVLHPLASTVGRAVTLEHVDGTMEHSAFPELVDPVQPFLNLRTMSHEVLPGVTATVRMEGEAFETEDHRNWTDASFKTYVRPLAKPWPYVIDAGEDVVQSVSVTLTGKPPRAAKASGTKAIAISVGAPTDQRVPIIGLGLPAHEVASSVAMIDRVQLAAPRLLIAQIDLRQATDPATLAGIRRLSETCEASLMLEVIVASLDQFGAELDTLAKALDLAGIKPESLAVVPVGDLKSVLPGGERPPAPPLEDLYAAARRAFPGVKLGGGMFSFFTELNRKRVPARLLDFVTNTTCPTVHASDDRSVMETLEALPHQVRTARSFIGSTPYRIGPSAIGCRDNPHGATYTPNPDNERVCLPLIDPRMRALFGAAWITGYIATLARTDVEAVSIGATTGPLGIISGPASYDRPFFDQLAPGAVYPSFHVIAGLARASGSTIVETTCGDPSRVACIAYRQAPGTVLWVANLTAHEQQVRISGLGNGRKQYGVLDETSFVAATTDPVAFQSTSRPLESDSITLQPYATAFIGSSS